jgi:Protein of unknown function (DUF2846)
MMTNKFRKVALTAALCLSATAAFAAGNPVVTKSGALPTPAAGQGQVVFFRPGSLMGAALGCTVHEGEAQIARLGSGKYYVVPAAPGVHQYNTRGERRDELKLEVEEGETYFVRCNIGMGMMSGSANLSPSDEGMFAKKARGLALWSGPKS